MSCASGVSSIQAKDSAEVLFKFLYIFDYGDEWRFQITVLRIVDEPTDRPIVLKSEGEINQYGYDEDDEDEDDEDF